MEPKMTIGDHIEVANNLEMAARHLERVFNRCNKHFGVSS